MKKTILKSLLLGAAALTALTASANLRIFTDDMEIAPGTAEYEFVLYAEHDKPFSSIQLELAQIEGLNIIEVVNPRPAYRDDTWPVNSDDEILLPNQEFNASLFQSVTYYTGTCAYTYNGKKLVAFFAPGTSCFIRFKVSTSENFKGGELKIIYGKSDYSDPDAPEDWVNIQTIENEHVCNITVPVTGTPLADIVASGVDGTDYTVADDLQIVAKTSGGLFVSDGQGNWMRLKGDVLADFDAKDYIKGGTLKGELSSENGNQLLTVTEAQAPVTGQEPTFNVEPTAWNLADVYKPKANEVISLTGYWIGENNVGEFRGYSNNGNGGGQSATANFAWCSNTPTMVNGQKYTNVVSAVQLKAAWDGTKMAENDDLYFQNLTVYPTAVNDENVVTGVENLNGDKSVVSVQYVNVAGQISNTPFQGVNMVVTRYADGSTVTTKVIK